MPKSKMQEMHSLCNIAKLEFLQKSKKGLFKINFFFNYVDLAPVKMIQPLKRNLKKAHYFMFQTITEKQKYNTNACEMNFL